MAWHCSFLQQAEYNCIKTSKAQFGPQTFDMLKKKEQGKFLALVNQVWESREYLVPIFKSSFPAYLNQALPNTSLLEILGYCSTRGCGQM